MQNKIKAPKCLETKHEAPLCSQLGTRNLNSKEFHLSLMIYRYRCLILKPKFVESTKN